MNMNMNNGSTGKHTVVVHSKNPDTEKQKVRVYDFDSQKEAIEFFDDLRRMDRNGETFNKIVGIWYTWPDGSVIFDNATPEPETTESGVVPLFLPLTNCEIGKLEG